MDRSWINASWISDVYEKDVEDFIEFAKRNGARINERYFLSLCELCEWKKSRY